MFMPYGIGLGILFLYWKYKQGCAKPITNLTSCRRIQQLRLQFFETFQ